MVAKIILRENKTIQKKNEGERPLASNILSWLHCLSTKRWWSLDMFAQRRGSALDMPEAFEDVPAPVCFCFHEISLHNYEL